MIKSRITRLFIAGTAGLLISCNNEVKDGQQVILEKIATLEQIITTNNSGLEQTINEVKDGQQVILKKMASLEKSINNLFSVLDTEYTKCGKI